MHACNAGTPMHMSSYTGTRIARPPYLCLSCLYSYPGTGEHVNLHSITQWLACGPHLDEQQETQALGIDRQAEAVGDSVIVTCTPYR